MKVVLDKYQYEILVEFVKESLKEKKLKPEDLVDDLLLILDIEKK